MEFMVEQKIERVVCLLEEFNYFDFDLLDRYRSRFGAAQVFSHPIRDFNYIAPEGFAESVYPVLEQSVSEGRKTVVHCSAGSGRTGHVLAAWAYCHGLADLDTVIAHAEATANPYEAASGFVSGKKALRTLILDCARKVQATGRTRGATG